MKSLRKNEKREDVISLLSYYQKTVIANKPSLEIMLDEIKMMNFKIRPLSGDFSVINGMDSKLIEMIWNLGKLDELYREKENLLKSKDRKLFMKFFESLHEKFQKDLGFIKLKNIDQSEPSNILEMEVFREAPRRRRVN
mgnify:FL=1